MKIYTFRMRCSVSDNDFTSLFLTEDLIDDFEPAVKPAGNVVITDTEDELFRKENYSHNFKLYIRRASINPSLALKEIPLEEKTETFHRMIQRILVPYIENMRYFEDIYAGWYHSPNGETVEPVSKTREFFLDTDSLKNESIEFVIFFNTYPNLNLRKIIWILEQLWNVKEIMCCFNHFVAVSVYYILDDYNSENYYYNSSIHRAIETESLGKVKEEKSVRHFISLFSKSRQVLQEFKDSFTKSYDSDGFMGTSYNKSNYARILRNPEDMLNGKISFETISDMQVSLRNPQKNASILVMRILKGASVSVMHHWTDPDVIFLVEGTLRIYNTFEYENKYSRNQNDYVIERLAKDFNHNEVILEPDFRVLPRTKDRIKVDMKHRHIERLVITATDKYIEDEEHLREVFGLENAENIKEIKYRVTEQ